MPLAAGLSESLALCLTAVTVGAVHTLLGPDHYVPFVAMSRAGEWSLGKTLRVTATCGLAHVAGSVVIGLIGLALGLAVLRLEMLEAFRGDVAAWLMIGFGLAYMTWGLVQATRSHGGPHEHSHAHADGTVHSHPHAHDTAHLHVHDGHTPPTAAAAAPVWSPWLLFLVFAFGPCEPLIPLLMYPAAKASWWMVAAVALAFTAATIVTMSAAVVVLRSGATFLPAKGLQHYAHACAGAAILACGVLITLGL
jgi:ABC-type nickel/cobalt efflux system permease component RcnA